MSKFGVIENDTGDLLRWNPATAFTDAALGESARSDVPDDGKRRHEPGESNMSRWNGTAWVIVAQPIFVGDPHVTSLTTTDATPTVLVRLPVAKNAVYQIDSVIQANRASNGDAASMVARACFKRVGPAAPNLVGLLAFDIRKSSDTLTWDAQFAFDGNDAVIRAVGEAAAMIQWKATTKRTEMKS